MRVHLHIRLTEKSYNTIDFETVFHITSTTNYISVNYVSCMKFSEVPHNY